MTKILAVIHLSVALKKLLCCASHLVITML